MNRLVSLSDDKDHLPNVGAETSFGNDVTVLVFGLALFGSGEFERNLVGNDRRVAVRNVGERTRVDKDGRALERLHDVGLDRVLHEDRERTRATNVVARDRFSRRRLSDDHASETVAHEVLRASVAARHATRENDSPFAHVGKIVREGEDSHRLGRDGRSCRRRGATSPWRGQC